MRCNKYFTLILLQFVIYVCVGHPGRTYMSTWFCFAKLGATVLVQDRCTVCAESTIGYEIILAHPMELLGDVGHVESRLVRLEMVLVLM